MLVLDKTKVTFKAAGAALGLLMLAACSVAPGEETDLSEAAQTRSTCGDGVRDASEQCDDGNTTNLDGCSATCTFEQVHRLNSVQMMFNTDSYCTANALGGAVKGVAQGQLQDALGNAVNSGQISILLPFMGLSDLSGQNAPSFMLGSLVGDPAPNVINEADAWYTPNPASISSDRQPLVTVSASITNASLAVGPGNFAFALNFGGTAIDARLSNTRLKAQVGSSNAPKASSGASPGHLGGENLDPALKSFSTMSGGQLCGNINAGSLAAVPVPAQLQSGGSANCTQGYTSANTMLDVFASGCRVLFVTALAATQPDQADPTAPALGAGAPYSLVVGAGKKVTGCKDKSGASVDLAGCMKTAAYSTAFKFGTERVIVR
jgi:cysteine-rich repeat protein